MGLFDILEGKLPFWKEFPAGCSTMPGISTPESEIVRLINSRYRKHKCQKFDTNDTLGAAGPEVKELRTVTTVTSDGLTRFLILHNSSNAQEVLEVSLQASGPCNVQIFEGDAPFSAMRFVDANLLFSEPGKKIYKSLYLSCDVPSVIIQVEVRSIAIP